MKTINSAPYRQILDVLVATRKSRNITQVDLAKKLDKPQSFVSKVEGRERRIDIAEFFEICRALEANPIALLQQAGLVTPADMPEPDR